MSKTVAPGRVSLIVASYNHARYLPARMECLINQTYDDIEIVVIDDCSPDNSVDVLRNYENHPKVRLIVREENGGWVTVSNQGIAESTGEFVIFANCDDSCETTLVERLVQSMQQHETAGIAFCRSLMVDENDQIIGDDFTIREQAFQDLCQDDTFIDRRTMHRFLLRACVIPNLSQAMIRRNCFAQSDQLTEQYKACSDWDLFFRIAEHFDFSYVAEPLNHFRQHGKTIRSATKGRVEYDEFFTLLLGEIRTGNLSDTETRHFRLHVMYLWALELMRPALSGWKNFLHHLALVWKLDKAALPYLPVAMVKRLFEFPEKAMKRLCKQPEWSNFSRHLRRHPSTALGYGLSLSKLIVRRVQNKFRLRKSIDLHMGLKQWPEWLGENEFKIALVQPEVLNFPTYRVLSDVAPELPSLALLPYDPEHAFEPHRWMHCLEAAIQNSVDGIEDLEAALDWIADFPARDQAAWEPYSTSERVANLCLLLSAKPDLWAAASLDQKTAIADFLLQSAQWIHDHLEYYGDERTNNHILNNARALCLTGAVLDNHDLLLRGMKLMTRMGRMIFGPDGCVREHSSHYQFIVAGWMLDAQHFAAHTEAADPYLLEELTELAERVGRASQTFLSVWPNLACQIGDISPDNHPKLAATRLQAMYPDYQPAPIDGARKLDQWAFVQRDQQTVVACGLLASHPEPFTTHGHNDFGSFVWRAEEQEILVDAGRCSYGQEIELLDQTSHVAHNTVAVNGFGPLAQSLLRIGYWQPEPYCSADACVVTTDRDKIMMRHDGFTRLISDEVTIGEHRRIVELTEDGLLVSDQISGSGAVTLENFWHLAPGFEQIASDKFKHQGSGTVIMLDAKDLGDLKMYGKSYIYSNVYGHSEKAMMVVVRQTVTLPLDTQTRFVLAKD